MSKQVMPHVTTRNLVNSSIPESTASIFEDEHGLYYGFSESSKYDVLIDVLALSIEFFRQSQFDLIDSHLIDKSKVRPQFVESDEYENTFSAHNYIDNKLERYPNIDEINKLDKVKELFNIFDQTEIINYLILNYYLVEVLIEAHKQINKYLDEQELILELIKDPESETLSEQLVLYIVTGLPVKEAIKKRNDFDKEWWIKNISLAKGNLCITVDYK